MKKSDIRGGGRYLRDPETGTRVKLTGAEATGPVQPTRKDTEYRAGEERGGKSKKGN